MLTVTLANDKDMKEEKTVWQGGSFWGKLKVQGIDGDCQRSKGDMGGMVTQG